MLRFGRTVSLPTRGIGQPTTAPVVKGRRIWLKVGENLR